MKKSITPDQQQAILEILCQLLLQSEDPRIRSRAAESLGRLGVPTAIPALCRAVVEDQEVQVRLSAIDALVLIAKPELLTLMPETPKNQPTFQINQVGNINTGDVTIQGDQVGIQNNYGTDAEFQATISELKAILNDLQTKYPNVATETEALTIIEAEFAEIKRSQTPRWATLRKQLLNPERHLQALKAALVEVVKHYFEESLLAKAGLTYLDKMSEEPDYGA